MISLILNALRILSQIYQLNILSSFLLTIFFFGTSSQRDQHRTGSFVLPKKPPRMIRWFCRVPLIILQLLLLCDLLKRAKLCWSQSHLLGLSKTRRFWAWLPLFMISEHRSKQSLANHAALSKVFFNIQSYLAWLISMWDERVDLSAYPGSTSPAGHTSPEEVVRQDTIREQILNDSQRLLEAFSSFQNGLELISNGLQTSCEINAATIVTFRHHGHFLVLDHCWVCRCKLQGSSWEHEVWWS